MTTTEQIQAAMTRHNLNTEQAAQYFGVSPHTLIKWLNGTRTPTATTARLVEVLAMLETLAPDIHDGLLPST